MAAAADEGLASKEAYFYVSCYYSQERFSPMTEFPGVFT
jgi:hypothetical protein